MKKAILLTLILLMIAPLAKADIFGWHSYSEQSKILGFHLYRSYSSLTCEEEFDIPDPSVTTYNTGNATSAFAFYTITAYNANKESKYANEILQKYCNGISCSAYFNITTSPNSVLLEWESIPSVNEYQLQYKKISDNEYTVLEVSSPYSLDLDPGDYVFVLYAKDALGRTIEKNNVFPIQQGTISNSPPPSPPDYKIEAFKAVSGEAGMQTLMMAFDSDDNNIDYYLVNVFSSSSLALSGNPGDLLSNMHVDKGGNFCHDFDVQPYFNSSISKYRLGRPILFVTIASVDYNGQIGDAVAGYKLMGNVIGTDNDGVSYSSAIVNTSDLNVLQYYYYKQGYAQRSTDYCSETNLYDILPLTPWERMDNNHNNIVDGGDYNFFIYTWQETGAGK